MGKIFTSKLSKDKRLDILVISSIVLVCSLVLIQAFHLGWVLFVVISFLLVVCLVGTLIHILSNKRDLNQETEYESFLENLPISVLFIRDNKICYINSRGLELFEANSENEVIGKSLFDFTSIDESLSLAENKRTTENESGTIIGKLRTCKNDIKAAKINYQYGSFRQQQGYSVVIKDITQFKENEKKLHHSEQLSVLGELAAGIAHEIRNPLTSLMGFLQLIEGEGSSTKMYKEIMGSELERINLIVNELLLLSKPKEYEFEEKHLLSLLETVVTIANTQAILHNIQIVSKPKDDVKDVMVFCEENKLKQVFLNLIKNGIEAMSKEGQIIIEVYKSDEIVHIAFIDQGDGIPDGMIENLGKRFYTTKEDGTGLGLMISMNIIREHKGNIDISSKKGVGTRMEVRLPLNTK